MPLKGTQLYTKAYETLQDLTSYMSFYPISPFPILCSNHCDLEKRVTSLTLRSMLYDDSFTQIFLHRP